MFIRPNQLNYEDQKSKKDENCKIYNILSRIYIYYLSVMKNLYRNGNLWTIRPLGLNRNYQEKNTIT